MDSELVVKPRLCKEFTDIRAVYELDEKAAGKGHHSVVFRAKHKTTGDAVAIKITKKCFRGIEHSIRKEKDALVAVKGDPNVMNFIELQEDEMNFYEVLEWVNGDDLCERLTRSGGVMHESDVRVVIRSLFRCLASVHRQKIIHRDVKLRNIIFASKDTNVIKLIDFGAAEIITKANEEEITKIVGTQKYLAPEVFNRRGYNTLVDVWSAGVVLYTLLTGAEPFTGHGPALVEKIQEGLGEIPRSISSEARDLLRKTLERKAEKRLTAEQALLHPFLRLPKDALSSHNLQAGYRNQFLNFRHSVATRLRTTARAVLFLVFLKSACPSVNTHHGRGKQDKTTCRHCNKGGQVIEIERSGELIPLHTSCCAAFFRDGEQNPTKNNASASRYSASGHPVCNGCNRIISDPSQGVESEVGFFHVDCFCCAGCEAPITGSCVAHGGRPYHAGCQERGGAGGGGGVLPHCASCGERLRGGVQWGGQAYHESCFSCAKCRLVINGDAEAFSGLPYHAHCIDKMRACMSESYVELRDTGQPQKGGPSEKHTQQERHGDAPKVLRTPGARRVSLPVEGSGGGGGGGGVSQPQQVNVEKVRVSSVVRVEEDRSAVPVRLSKFCHECGQGVCGVLTVLFLMS